MFEIFLKNCLCLSKLLNIFISLGSKSFVWTNIFILFYFYIYFVFMNFFCVFFSMCEWELADCGTWWWQEIKLLKLLWQMYDNIGLKKFLGCSDTSSHLHIKKLFCFGYFVHIQTCQNFLSFLLDKALSTIINFWLIFLTS